MGEDDVDFFDESGDEANVVHGARDDDGVGAFVGEDRGEAAEFIGAGTEEGIEAGNSGDGDGRDGGGGRGSGGRRRADLTRADGLGIGALGGGGLAGDELSEERGNLHGFGVLEVNDFVAGIGIGLTVELRDEFVEERPLARVGDDHDLVGAVVRRVGGGGAELQLERAGEDGAEFTHEVAGLGGF